MNVNIITESVIFPKQLGGVHVAFLNQLEMLKKTNVKILINYLGKADITHIHTIWPFALYKLLTSSRTVLPSHHLPESFIGSYRGGRLFQSYIKRYLRFFYNKSDLVLAMSEEVKEKLQQLGVTTRIEILPNPINTNVFKKDKQLRNEGRAEYKIKNEKFVVLSAGYLIPRKGVTDFIMLAHKFPEVTFVWAGGIPAKLFAAETEVQNKLLQNLPSNLIITGFASYSKMPTFYNMADIFLFPSYQETQGFVIVEAAACGLPLVLRDLSLYKELYGNNYVQVKTASDFEEAVKKLHPKGDLYHEYARKSTAMAQKFSYAVTASQLLAFYRSLLP